MLNQGDHADLAGGQHGLPCLRSTGRRIAIQFNAVSCQSCTDFQWGMVRFSLQSRLAIVATNVRNVTATSDMMQTTTSRAWPSAESYNIRLPVGF